MCLPCCEQKEIIGLFHVSLTCNIELSRVACRLRIVLSSLCAVKSAALNHRLLHLCRKAFPAVSKYIGGLAWQSTLMEAT